ARRDEHRRRDARDLQTRATSRPAAGPSTSAPASRSAGALSNLGASCGISFCALQAGEKLRERHAELVHIARAVRRLRRDLDKLRAWNPRCKLAREVERMDGIDLRTQD